MEVVGWVDPWVSAVIESMGRGGQAFFILFSFFVWVISANQINVS